ncbi:TetR/AcrR family transcriptional regulator [Streptomyces sp. NPDC056656]|uniref:TetR/AcrR family transcriptional regulator n=1 Tax=Streptomyces sp. NPDC056656 TaxID=3345895 RepID=UPI00369CC90F
MPDNPPRLTRPRGRPPKDAQFAPTDQVLAAAIEAFSVHGYNGVSLRAVNEQLGGSRNLLHQRFGSKAKLWEAAVDWAFRPLVDHLVAGDDESADPMVRLRMLIRNFIEYSAERPYLARVITLEGVAATDRLEYLYRHYIEPIRARYILVFELLAEQGRIKKVPYETFYFLLTSGGSALYGQTALASMMNPELTSTEETRVRLYAESVAEVILNGLALPG